MHYSILHTYHSHDHPPLSNSRTVIYRCSTSSICRDYRCPQNKNPDADRTRRRSTWDHNYRSPHPRFFSNSRLEKFRSGTPSSRCPPSRGQASEQYALQNIAIFVISQYDIAIRKHFAISYCNILVFCNTYCNIGNILQYIVQYCASKNHHQAMVNLWAQPLRPLCFTKS